MNLSAAAAERHTEPSGNCYRLSARAGRGEALASTALPKVGITVYAVLV